MTDIASCFELAAAERRALGIVLTRLPGEYRVNYRNAGDGTVRLAEDLEQAVALGHALAAESPAAAVRKGRRRPLRMTPKAVRRRMIKQHNRRLRARMLRKQREDS